MGSLQTKKKKCCYGISRLITEHLAKCERAIVKYHPKTALLCTIQFF